jgi:hypothetical protein
MSKATRILAMAGLALAAGATIGATPAMASPSAPQGTTVVTQEAAPKAAKSPTRSWYQGTYRSYRACVIAGRIGVARGFWDDYDCDRTRRGFRLEVERRWSTGHWNHGNWGNNGHNWNNWNHRGGRDNDHRGGGRDNHGGGRGNHDNHGGRGR